MTYRTPGLTFTKDPILCVSIPMDLSSHTFMVTVHPPTHASVVQLIVTFFYKKKTIFLRINVALTFFSSCHLFIFTQRKVIIIFR
jgi:hypothetical protein